MQVINQIGHVQFWGMSPAINFLADYSEPSVRVLLTGCSDIRHILKTICDVCTLNKFKNIEVYFHETNKQLICRAMLLLHVIHEQNLNLEERVELFLDLYGNCLIKQKTAKYLSNVVPDLQNLIHDEPKTSTTLKNIVDFKYVKFDERDQFSEIIGSWKANVPFEMESLRDRRLRYLYKERYDFRTNLIDWDYNMLLTEYAPIIHYYHYREWRQTGLAFENRYSTYVHPNRTLSSYIPGKKSSTKESCLVRGFWGDIVCSPYLAMGIECDYPQAAKLFQKANEKYIGHSMEVTEYNLRYFLQKIQSLKDYIRIFEDYYRSEQRQKDLETEKQKQRQQLERQKRNKETNQDIKEEPEEQDKQTEKEQHKKKTAETQNTPKQKSNKIEETSTKETEVSETKQKPIEQAKQNKAEEVDLTKPVKFDPKKMTQQQYQAKVKIRREAIDARQVQYLKVEQPVLEGFKRVGFRFFPICMNLDSMKKKKFKEFFDVGIIGFSHTAYLQQDIKEFFKTDARVYVQTARFLISHRKEKRAELDQTLEQLVCSNGFVVTDKKLKHHLECSKM